MSTSILILGNGFDIANGYKTKYSDFYDSNYFKNELNQGNILCKRIKDEINRNSLWRDLEFALYKYSCELTNGNRVNNEFEEEFNRLREALFHYIEEVAKDSVDEQGRYCIKELYKCWIDKLNPQILSFNYTVFSVAMRNCRCMYNADDSFNQDYFIPQHGCTYIPQKYVNATSDNIVLGIDDSQKVEDAHSFLYKSKQQRRDIGFLFDQFKQKDVFIIYGCSMGASDRVYFEKLFKLKNKKFLVYHYNNESELKETIKSYNPDTFATNDIRFVKVNANAKVISETKNHIEDWLNETVC